MRVLVTIRGSSGQNYYIDLENPSEDLDQVARAVVESFSSAEYVAVQSGSGETIYLNAFQIENFTIHEINGKMDSKKH
jgi:hypothetical protein